LLCPETADHRPKCVVIYLSSFCDNHCADDRDRNAPGVGSVWREIIN
jgi:hypothetical protein